MSRKRYMILVIALFVTLVAVLGTLALYYYRTETTGVNLANDPSLDPYINYKNGTPIISSNNAVLESGSDYTSGLSTEIEFWKKETARNMVLYGHVYLDVNTGSSKLLSEPGLKWTITSNNEVLATGDFTDYDEGDSIPILVNRELSSTQTYFQIYIWIDKDSISNDISGESLSLEVRCEASSEQYSQTYIERVNSDIINIGYTGNVDEYVVPRNGTYKLEVWGSQGGNATYGENSYNGGYGGYSTGTVSLNRGDTLYIVVGSAGESVSYVNSTVTHDESTGYNGGGRGVYYSENSTKAGGGGATHIATKQGLLKQLSSNTSSVLIVAGGGGGAISHKSAPNYSGNGGYGGGYIGGPGVPASNTCYGYGLGGTQTEVGGYTQCATDGKAYVTSSALTVGGFGLGYNYSTYYTGSYGYAGGGAGYYGGMAGYYAPGGGGSGYVNSTSLTNTKMYCFNCDESIENNTYTTVDASEDAVSTSAKIGNGYARITRLS